MPRPCLACDLPRARTGVDDRRFPGGPQLPQHHDFVNGGRVLLRVVATDKTASRFSLPALVRQVLSLTQVAPGGGEDSQRDAVERT